MAARFAWPRRQRMAVGPADPSFVILVGHCSGFVDNEEFGKFNLCFPNSCQNPRQQVEAGTARRPAISSAR